MEETILISYLNDFIFCPISIYFHKLYGDEEKTLYQREEQINGTNSHKSIDQNTYSTRKDILQGIEVYTEKYNIIGKIDMFDIKSKTLTEKKNYISQIYDGYVFQLYAQFFALKDMGYDIEKIRLYSIKDNKIYNIKLPSEDKEMFIKFENLITEMKNFNMKNFVQENVKKCENCIYEPACDRSLIC